MRSRSYPGMGREMLVTFIILWGAMSLFLGELVIPFEDVWIYLTQADPNTSFFDFLKQRVEEAVRQVYNSK